MRKSAAARSIDCAQHLYLIALAQATHDVRKPRLESIEMYEIDYSLAWKLELGNNLSGCNVVSSMNMSRFYFPQWHCLTCEWNARCDDEVSINPYPSAIPAENRLVGNETAIFVALQQTPWGFRHNWVYHYNYLRFYVDNEAPKPEILNSGNMTDRMTIPTANLGFSTTLSSKKLTRAIATTADNRKWQHRRFARQFCNFW